MTLSPQFLDEIRARTVLSALIGRSIKLVKAGREYKACCPFHNEKTPSFTVVDDKQFFHCHGCGAHGDAIRWLTDHQGLPFMEAVKELADAVGMDWPADVKMPGTSGARAAPVERVSVRQDEPDPYVSSEDMAELVLRRMMTGSRGPVCTYLAARGIGRSMLRGRLNDIGFCPDAPVAKWDVRKGPSSVPTAPAMVSRLRRPDPALPSSEWPLTGLHITYLNPDCTGKMRMATRSGRDRPARKMLGIVQGSCVVLGEYDPAAPLVAGEGIESTFSGLDQCGLSSTPCALAALSLNNLQGYALPDARGALPVWNLQPAMSRDALWFAHRGPVTVLVDADMKATPVWLRQSDGRPVGPRIAERARGPYVIREISSRERAEHCATLAIAGWQKAGARGPVRALRPRMGMDFNDQARAGDEVRA